MTKGNLRVAIDSGLAIAIVSLAFWVGVQSEKINTLEVAVTNRGRVQISIEADHRLTKLEEQMKNAQEKLK